MQEKYRLIIATIIGLCILLIIWYFGNAMLSRGNDDDMVVCTQDVKQCPDGTYVSRHAPHCEFAPCSGVQ